MEALEQAERERLHAAAEGRTPWTMPPAKQAELLCTWNAFVLQTLGNAFLDADYRDNPATVGFVPPITADQVLRFYTPVEGWLTRAQQAHADPNFRLDVAVPADVPAWSEVEPFPNSHCMGCWRRLGAQGLPTPDFLLLSLLVATPLDRCLEVYGEPFSGRSV